VLAGLPVAGALCAAMCAAPAALVEVVRRPEAAEATEARHGGCHDEAQPADADAHAPGDFQVTSTHECRDHGPATQVAVVQTTARFEGVAWSLALPAPFAIAEAEGLHAASVITAVGPPNVQSNAPTPVALRL
jgi:hypothetical protein